MSDQREPQPQRMQQTMPEDGGWHRIDAGPHLHIMFHPPLSVTEHAVRGVVDRLRNRTVR
jgi:adenosylmethionine-8-amino-7-oxononanoate aminotransferase